MAILLKNCTLVQLDPALVQPGDLRIREGLISEVGDNLAPVDEETIDCDGAIVLPGLVNGHTHLYSALAAGMPGPPRPPENFHEILQFVWWRLDRAHDLRSVELSGAVGALAAIRCGVTTLIDHHASPNCIAGSLDALRQGISTVGCRGVLCYETTDRNRSTEAVEGIAENRRFIEACRAEGSQKFAGLVGAHANFTLGDASLAACVEACCELDAGLHIHVAEDGVDERMVLERHGVGLIERMQQFGVLDLPNTIFAHGTHFTDEDVAAITPHQQNITMAHNPSSNMNNGVGYARVCRHARPPMLGTDGIGCDLWREARQALFKSHDGAAAIPFDWPLKMLAASARYASRQLGVTLGAMDVGAAADLVVTDFHSPTALTAESLANHSLFNLGPEYVCNVMIDGQWVLRDREFLTCNSAVLHRLARDESERLHKRMN